MQKKRKSFSKDEITNIESVQDKLTKDQMKLISKDVNRLLSRLADDCLDMDAAGTSEFHDWTDEDIMNATLVFSHYIGGALIRRCIKHGVDAEDIHT